VLDRINIRGVSAAVAGLALAVTAVVVGPAVASGAEADHRYSTPMSAADQKGLLHWTLLNAHYLRHVHRARPHQAVASRASARAPLTGDPQAVAHALLLRTGASEAEWSCLDALWSRESGWNTYATNGSSGAYGIPQALPGDKMATFGADWRTDPITQIRWGLWYISTAYGSPCAALQHSTSYGYY
jgi:transglycosylase-like protein with SLT domain